MSDHTIAILDGRKEGNGYVLDTETLSVHETTFEFKLPGNAILQPVGNGSFVSLVRNKKQHVELVRMSATAAGVFSNAVSIHDYGHETAGKATPLTAEEKRKEEIMR